ncbi:hypothetical protein Tco_0563915 [Tanacetum coccineum]
MGNENPICTLRDYSKPSHEGYRNTIELFVGNNVDLALYDNESCNDPRVFVKPANAITLPQDVPSTSDCRLIELENQVQHLMEAHLAPTQPTQVNKVTTSCEICSGPYDIQYFMEDPEQAFVKYASSRTDEAGGALPSDTIKNPKLSTSPVLSARSYLTIDPQCSSHPSTSINAIKDLHLNLSVLEVLAHAPIYNAILDKYVESLELGKNGSAFVQGEIQAKMEDPGLFTLPCRLGDSEPFDTLVDLGLCVNIILLYLFKKLNIGLLEETDHIFGLADRTKSYPVGIVKDVEKDPETPLLIGRGFLATANAVIDCKMAKIAVGEGITRSVFVVKGVNLGEEEAPYWTTLGKRESCKPRPSLDGVGTRTPYYARKDFLDCHLPEEWEIPRDTKLNPFKDVIVFRRMVEFLGAILLGSKDFMMILELILLRLECACYA